jgi:hypothetical protein
MTLVFPRFDNGEFSPEAAHVMVEAFDRACLVSKGAGLQGGVQDAMANRILEQAVTGERDPDRLCKAALKGMDL